MFQLKFVLYLEQTTEKYKNQLSRNGATLQLLNQVLPKLLFQAQVYFIEIKMTNQALH